MEKTFCDRCKEEINAKQHHYYEGHIYENMPTRKNKTRGFNGKNANFHFCAECWEEMSPGQFNLVWEKD